MSAQRLRQVVYELPAVSRNAQQFFANLARILDEVENRTLGGGKVVIAQRDPAGLLPETVFRVANSTYPAILLDMGQPLSLTLGNLVLKTPGASATVPAVAERTVSLVEDALGLYAQLPPESEDFTALLPLESVLERLKGHVLRLDHTGVNVPTRMCDRDGWDLLIAALAAASNMYRYPTGEEWPFIVPATADEFESDITDLRPVRRPKFELVYDETLSHPLIQLDLETDLTRAEIEARFPAPYGVGLPGLDGYFRSVYVYHPWPGLSIRIDMGYWSETPGDMAGWLVHEGGRIAAG